MMFMVFMLYLMLVVFVFGTVASAITRSPIGVMLFASGSAYALGCLAFIINILA